MASLILLLLGWVFVPFYLRNGVFTMPEFLERRYSPAARWYLAIISIIGYVLTKISVTIVAGGIVLGSVMEINFWIAAIIVVIFTGLYTILGGLTAILFTDLIQIVVIIFGSVTTIIFGLNALGGWGQMTEVAGSDFMNMWKASNHPAFPWTGILFGVPILGVWYWCTDQFIVQRVLSAKNIEHARGGAIFGGFLKTLPLFLFVIPGIIAYCLARKGIIELPKSDEALPTLILKLLPIGFRGLVVAGLIAALTSSLASVFNSCSTLITMDIYKKLKPKTSEKALVRIGQFSTLILVLLGLAWIPLMKLISEQLYQYLQSVQAYIAPPITAVFVWGICWKRVNSKGALAALFTGFIIGMARLILELNKNSIANEYLLKLVEINFLHFTILLFVICSVVHIAVSLCTKPMQMEQLKGLTFSSLTKDTKSQTSRDLTNVILSLLLIAFVFLIWFYFSK